MIELCPFCGSHGKLREVSASYEGDRYHYVECKVCGAQGPPVFHDMPAPGDDHGGMAVRQWNRRDAPIRTGDGAATNGDDDEDRQDHK